MKNHVADISFHIKIDIHFTLASRYFERHFIFFYPMDVLSCVLITVTFQSNALVKYVVLIIELRNKKAIDLHIYYKFLIKVASH